MNRILTGVIISFALLTTGCSGTPTSQAAPSPLNLPSAPASSSAAPSSAQPSASETATSEVAVAESATTCPSTSDLIKDWKPAKPRPVANLIDVLADPPLAKISGPYVFPYCGRNQVEGIESYDPHGTIVGWEWDLNGDGTMDCPYNDYWMCPIGNLPEGEYTVTLIVTNDLGIQVRDTTTLMIAPKGTKAVSGKTAAAYIKKHSTKPVINVSKNIKIIPATTNGGGFLEPYLLAWLPKKPLTFPTGYLLLVSGYGYDTMAKLNTVDGLSYDGTGKTSGNIYMRFCKPGKYTLVVAEPRKKTRTIHMTVTGANICSQGTNKPPLLPEPEQGQG